MTLRPLIPLLAVSAFVTASAMAADPDRQPASPTFGPDGIVHVPAFDLPPSPYMSEEAVQMLKRRAEMQERYSPSEGSENIEQARQNLEKMLAPQVEAMRERYPADVAEQTIGGVKTRVFTPREAAAHPDRVLINLHGGGFKMCADSCARLESLPMAALGGYKVVSVDYRQGPEFTFPAASEDVAAVYRELLKDYSAANIGMYGCSAGGALTGQSTAWLLDRGQPVPGAIGIFGAGAGRFAAGDSAHVAAYIDGSFPPPGAQPPTAYFEGADMQAPLVSPMMHLDVLKGFPPALIITGTRAMDMSPAVYTNSQLIKAGVRSNLIVAEGMSHCYLYSPQLPESRDAYRAIVDFFDRNLN